MRNIHADDDGRALERIYAKAVSGDVRHILSFFENKEEANQSEYAELFEKYKQRFITNEEPLKIENPYISNLILYYTTYWRTSLLDPKKEPKARKTLRKNLSRLIKDEGHKTGLFQANRLDSALIRIAEENGYHLLLGTTNPLRELMIWKDEERASYGVELSGERLSVEVVFLQNFLSKGWLGYATFNEKHTGGWATSETIYRVGGKPNKNDEWFRVSLVGHEGRHVSDKSKYGSLPGWKLEYRAKLTELILADRTFWKLLNSFKNEAKENKTIPHPHASFRLIGGLIEYFGETAGPENYSSFQFETHSVENLKQAAKMLLEESTRSLDGK